MTAARLGRLIAAGALLAMLAAPASAPAPTLSPRLVGYGCAGASGPIFAAEESDFPACERIETL